MLKKMIVWKLLVGLVLIFWIDLHAQLEQSHDTATSASFAASFPATHDELVDFFFAWRKFHAPEMNETGSFFH